MTIFSTLTHTLPINVCM